MTFMQNSNDNPNDFLFIHIRPGIESKGHPLATVAVHLVSENGIRYGVALASQHLKKDEKWNAAMGRFVAAGRAARSKERLFVYFRAHGRRDLIISAVERVSYAIETGEIKASRKVARAVNETVTRLNTAKTVRDFNRAVRDSAAAE